MTQTVYLGLGSNQGDRAKTLAEAIEALNALGQVIAQSSFVETKPYGFVSDFMFLNAVVALRTDLSAQELLQKTQAIEKAFGRKTKSKKGVYSDRPLDIDILFYGDDIIETETLTIPHRELHKRDFVLIPLMEIAPELIHPKLKQTIKELASR